MCSRLHNEQRTEDEIRVVDQALVEIERDRRTKRFSVYVAGSSAQMYRVLAVIAALRDAGIEVLSTWPKAIEAAGDPNPRDASCEARAGWAHQCLVEVAESSLVWFLVPDKESTRGAWVESGFAYALGKHLVFSGDSAQSVFCALGEEFTEDDKALRYVLQVARDRAEHRVHDGLNELRTAPAIDNRFDPSEEP